MLGIFVRERLNDRGGLRLRRRRSEHAEVANAVRFPVVFKRAKVAIRVAGNPQRRVGFVGIVQFDIRVPKPKENAGNDRDDEDRTPAHIVLWG